MATTLAGLLGFLYAPLQTIWGWAVLLGLGQGGTFSIALALIVLRSRDAHVASHLSGRPRASATPWRPRPFMVGVVHDLTGGWNAVGYIFIGVAVAATLFASAPGAARRGGLQRTPVAPQRKAPACGAFSFSSLRHPAAPSAGGVRGVPAIQSLSRL
ncbi:hypothetical protein [Pseudomonas aeruginosa]|uniref:hypothetical protein n=1 Tax=Pseudomonas aeruginosa TaxID=287 RepID=UPI003D9C0B98